MDIVVTVQISAELQKSLDRLGGFDAVTAAADGVYRYLIDYHSQMDWRGSNWIPGPNSGEFAQNVVKGWQPPEIAGDTAKIVNTFGLLSWKVTGGTITPKQAQALTIPLTTAAKGQPAPQFQGMSLPRHPGTGRFISRQAAALVRTGNALSLVLDKQIFPQYALVKSVTQEPWPGAMPTNEELSAAASEAVEQSIREAA